MEVQTAMALRHNTIHPHKMSDDEDILKTVMKVLEYFK
jgi:hypothetical protein